MRTATAEEYEAEAARLEAGLAEIERKYWGVRPGWVSTETAILRSQIADLRQKAAEAREAA